MSMDGMEALRLFAEQRNDEIFVGHMSCNWEWEQVSRHPELDVRLAGAMGKASSMGLGVALARPDRNVWVFDGDGSLLMNLGTLVTIGNASPRNLIHVVYENGTYDTTGGQPIPGAGTVDFAAMARAAGYARAFTVDNMEELQNRLPELLSGPNPTLVVLKVVSKERRPAAKRANPQSVVELRKLLSQQA